MYDDDFYGDYSEYELMVDAFKDKLKQEVKEEIKAEMARLREENKRLQDIKKNWNAKVAELEHMKTQLKREMSDAEYNAKKARLSELLLPYLTKAWGITCHYEFLREKCNNCDEKGNIHFTSPQGHEVVEQCDCRKKFLVYSPSEAEVVEINNNRNFPNGIHVIFKYLDNDRYREVSEVYNGEPFEDIEKHTTCYGLIFKKEEECQSFCDYMNKKSREKAQQEL